MHNSLKKITLTKQENWKNALIFQILIQYFSLSSMLSIIIYGIHGVNKTLNKIESKKKSTWIFRFQTM